MDVVKVLERVATGKDDKVSAPSPLRGSYWVYL